VLLVCVQAVETCHVAGWCVGDLKPDNILIERAGSVASGPETPPRVLFCDLEAFVELPMVCLEGAVMWTHCSVSTCDSRSRGSATECVGPSSCVLAFDRAMLSEMPWHAPSISKRLAGRAKCLHGLTGMPLGSLSNSCWYVRHSLSAIPLRWRRVKDVSVAFIA